MRKISLIIILLASAGAQAGTYLSNKSIENIITYDDYALLKFTPSDTSTNCPKTNHVHVDLSNDKGKAIYASALTAATAKKQVGLKIYEGNCDTIWQAAKLYQIEVIF